MKASDLPGHTYLQKARPEWSKGMPLLKAEGGPWPCDTCKTASFLCYRCSKCGAPLDDEGSASK